MSLPQRATVGRILRASQINAAQEQPPVAAGPDADSARLLAAQSAEAGQWLEERKAEILRQAMTEAKADATRRLISVGLATRRILDGLGEEIALAVAEGVERVLGTLDMRQAVAQAAAVALRELTDRHKVIVKVGPLAVEETRRLLAASAQGVDVQPDPALPPDGCIIETPAGYIRATLSEQIAALRDGLRQAATRD